MTKTMLSANSVRSLSDYVSNIETESKNMINRALEALARELEGNQHLIHQALLEFRNSLVVEPSDEEFYDLVKFVGEFTADFNENRIDVSIIADDQLTAWQNRSHAPQKSVRRNMILLLIDAAIEGGLLSGAGRLNDWLSFADGSELPGSWLLVGQGSSPKVSVGVPVVSVCSEDRFELLYRPLFDFRSFELSVRAANGLRNDGIYFVGDLVSRTEAELLRIPNLGKVSVAEIKVALDLLNLNLTLGCLNDREQKEFDDRRWLNEHAGQALYTANGEWTASSELVMQLEKMGITEITQLVTCPESELEQFAALRSDLHRLVYPYRFSSPATFTRTVPRFLNLEVKVYKHAPGEKSPTATE